MCRRVDPRITALIAEAGETYELVSRRRHQQLLIGGVVVVTIPWTPTEHGRCAENALAAVKRHLRRVRGET